MACEFFAEGHKYVLDGTRVLPNVTRILEWAMNGLADPVWYTEDARARGRYIHKVTQLLDDGGTWGAETTPLYHLYEPYVTAYRRFLRDLEPVWSQTESVVYDPLYGYAGTLDRAGLVAGVSVVVDIKSGEVPPSVGPQTAAYRRCLPDAPRWQRACLQLKPDGRYRYLPLGDRTDEGVFLAALTLYQWRAKHQLSQVA